MPTVLVTGSNRGIGLELCRQYSDVGWTVHACCRVPDKAAALQALASMANGRVIVHTLDVANHPQIEALAKKLRGCPIDVLLNNAGIYGPRGSSFGKHDYTQWMTVFAVNALAPMKMAEAFVDHVFWSERKMIISLTSLMGSIGDLGRAMGETGSPYPYRSSKAALNMIVRGMAHDLKARKIIAVAVHPGTVKTDMGGMGAPLSVVESVLNMRRLIDTLTLNDSGMFLSYNGSEIPW